LIAKDNVVEPREEILTEGMGIAFANLNGKGRIEFSAQLKRTLHLTDADSVTFPVKIRVRRFRSMLGVYSAGSRNMFSFRRSSRVVYVEAEIHVESNEAALLKLKEGANVMHWVWNSQGFVVGYSRTPGRNQINVSVHRIYIKGIPARNLQGHDDSSVEIYPTR
jgi:hypothetical protein